jgi:hypothetical protein
MLNLRIMNFLLEDFNEVNFSLEFTNKVIKRVKNIFKSQKR